MIEAASQGLIPIVTYIKGGFHEVSTKLQAEEINDKFDLEKAFADKIIEYIEDSEKAIDKKKSVVKSVTQFYNIQKTADTFFKILLQNKVDNKSFKKRSPKFDFRLDNKYLPNFLVKSTREILSILKR